MKTNFLIVLIFFLLSFFGAQATNHVIEVRQAGFFPADIHVNTGDTITWHLIEGNHTTTSVAIPDGAKPWDKPINPASPDYSYRVMVTGSYDYKCVMHSDVGHFTAGVLTGVPTISGLNLMNSNPATGQVSVSYYMEEGSPLSVALFDLTGKPVRVFESSAFHPSGLYNTTYSLAGLSDGLYFLCFRTDDGVITRKIVVE